MLAQSSRDTRLMYNNDHPEPGASHHGGLAGRQDQPRGELSAPPSQVPALPHPSLGLPAPGLAFEFRMAAKLRGDVCRVRLRNEGVRDLSVVEGGEWAAEFGKGTVRVSLALGGEKVETTANCSSLVVTTCRRHSLPIGRGREWTQLSSWRRATSRLQCLCEPPLWLLGHLS